MTMDAKIVVKRHIVRQRKERTVETMLRVCIFLAPCLEVSLEITALMSAVLDLP